MPFCPLLKAWHANLLLPTHPIKEKSQPKQVFPDPCRLCETLNYSNKPLWWSRHPKYFLRYVSGFLLTVVMCTVMPAGVNRISAPSVSSWPHIHLYFHKPSLFISFFMLSSLGISDICCAHFEDAPLGSIINRAVASFAFGGMETASLTGDEENACKLRRLINKIFYDNDACRKGRSDWR